MNSIAQAFAKVGISGGNTAEVDTLEPSYKRRELVSRETVYHGGARVLELKTGSAIWNAEHELVLVGRFVRVEGRHEFVNFAIPGMVESEIGNDVKGFFTIDRLVFDDEAVFHEIMVQRLSFTPTPNTTIKVGPKQYSEADIRLSCGGFIAVIDK